MERDVFIHSVRQVLAERGLNPRMEILNALPSTREEMRAAMNAPQYIGDKSIFQVPTKEQVAFAAKYYPQVREIVIEIARANPNIAREKWKGNVIVPQGTTGKLEHLANQVEKDKNLGSITDAGLWAKSLRTMKKPARANVWKATADNVAGFFQYMNIFHENYEKRAMELARFVAIRTYYKHFSNKGKISGPLTPQEGYQLYCKTAECNPLMHAHFEEIKIARGIRAANIWHDIHQERKASAENEAAAKKESRARKLKIRPRH